MDTNIFGRKKKKSDCPQVKKETSTVPESQQKAHEWGPGREVLVWVVWVRGNINELADVY